MESKSKKVLEKEVGCPDHYGLGISFPIEMKNSLDRKRRNLAIKRPFAGFYLARFNTAIQFPKS